MKLLLVAPGFAPPWTEGRKNFIRDLIPVLRQQATLEILSAAVAPPSEMPSDFTAVVYTQTKTKALQLFSLHKALKRRLASPDKPDIVLHFPYGTFDGLRGVANNLSVGKIHKLALKSNLPCLTILYSMTDGDLSDLQTKVTVATSESQSWSGHVVNVGLDLQALQQRPPRKNGKRLLFMAGYHENKSALLKNILYERGLIDIIHIGEQLAALDFQLSIAIPLLKYPERKSELRALLQKMAPSLPVAFFTQANVFELFSQHSLYLFPYRKNYNVFIPTSVLEAMAFGIPVIASDLPMLLPLIGDDDQFCLSYAARQPESLLEAISHVYQHTEESEARALRARQNVRLNWSVQRSAKQIMEIVSQLAGQTA
ncbi:MAG: glycosyltransferase family 4 protein [Chloroflexi bacterium]|nr:glycosyltransferase family 4 protein [Chloroflexota bacterium]